MDFLRKNWILLVLLAIGIVISLIWCFLTKKKAGFKVWQIILIIVIGFIWGFFAAKLFALIEVGFVWNKSATYRIFGPILFDTIYFLILAIITKRSFYDIAAWLIPTIIISLIASRINCLFEGCCKGTLISYESEITWPIREIEIGYHVLLLIFICYCFLKDKLTKQLYPIYFISYGVLRFILEFFRDHYLEGESNVFHLAHLWSFLFILIGVVWLILIKVNFAEKYFKKS